LAGRGSPFESREGAQGKPTSEASAVGSASKGDGREFPLGSEVRTCIRRKERRKISKIHSEKGVRNLQRCASAGPEKRNRFLIGSPLIALEKGWGTADL